MNAASPESSLVARQRRFAGTIRDPERTAVPADVSPTRMAVYRELFFNNILSVLEDAFPAVRTRLSESAWGELVRRFFAQHRSATPYFHRLPGEFAAWLEQQSDLDPPYLAELAVYEWSELQLALAPEPPLPNSLSPDGDPLAGAPVLAPLFRLVAFHYPVHRMYQGESPHIEGPTQLLLWRDDSEQVRTLALSPIAARLLFLIAENRGQSGRSLLLQIADDMNHPEPERLVEQGRTLLEQLREKEALAGAEAALDGGAPCNRC